MKATSAFMWDRKMWKIAYFLRDDSLAVLKELLFFLTERIFIKEYFSKTSLQSSGFIIFRQG